MLFHRIACGGLSDSVLLVRGRMLLLLVLVFLFLVVVGFLCSAGLF